MDILDRVYRRISFEKFKRYPSSDRTDLCLDYGTFLCQRETKNFRYWLFNYNDTFWAEMRCDKKTDNLQTCSVHKTLPEKLIAAYGDNLKVDENGIINLPVG